MNLAAPNDLPEALGARWAEVAAQLAGLDLTLPATLADSLPRVLVASQFVLDTLQRQPEALLARLADEAPVSAPDFAASLEIAGLAEREAMAVLRRRRNVEMAAVAWRDIAGRADLDAILTDLSALADAFIGVALEKAAALLDARYGRPTELLVLGMGKLGGHELNFSSDIDLVLLYPDPAPGEDADQIEEYVLRLAQRLIRLLDERTADGIVYRVDTRLRPFGQAGPLAISIGAFESYLVQHARDWERYAYVKARLITGRSYEAELFDQVLTPFVFRRYLDFGVFEALRRMKQLIEEDVARRDRHANIKLGRGGIREIEFIAQVFQLIRGGQEPKLRTRSLLEALTKLEALEVIEPAVGATLAASYRFLRMAENRLQALDDQQTHEIPKDPGLRERWAWAAGFESGSALGAEIERHRERVHAIFEDFGRDADEDSGESAETDPILSAWDEAGLARASDTPGLEQLDQLRQSGLYQRMDQTGRQRLRAFVAVLVPALAGLEAPATVLDRVMPVIRAICRRSAYLSLLLENRDALERLLNLADHSAMLARLVAEHPLLLDELLDPRLFDLPPTRAELEAALGQQLAGIAADDHEALLNAIRDFQRAAMFRVALADRYGGLPLMKVSDRLTDIAELVIELALGIASRELGVRHGVPMHGRPGELAESGLIVVAYGKLGGLELGYGSDLDLVFLHDAEGPVQETTGPAVIDSQRYFVRLVQRLIHCLSVQTSSGRLYEIDTRLRPDGASGLLVASLASFARYQREDAWTWEHQALLRSRSVAGPAALREAFERVRIETLTGAVRLDSLKADVAQMRERMRQELAVGSATEFDVKQDPGGLADIEFLIDYLVLANASRHPALVEFPDNVRQLEALEAAGLLAPETAASLRADYLALRARTHELALADGGRCVPVAEFAPTRERILQAWHATFGELAD